jgi:hypothetical protein
VVACAWIELGCGDILDGLSFLDFIFCPVSDEDGLAAPFDDHVLSFGDGGEVDFDFGLSKDVGRCGHVNQEVCWARTQSR